MPVARDYDVFISYRRESGAALAQLFSKGLKAHGVRVCLDTDERFWRPFSDELRERIVATPHFLLLLTPDCVKSDNMAFEIRTARESERRFLVVRQDRYELPTDAFEQSEWAYVGSLSYQTWQHEYSDAAVERIAKDIRAHTRRTGWYKPFAPSVWVLTVLVVLVAAGVAFAMFSPKPESQQGPPVPTVSVAQDNPKPAQVDEDKAQSGVPRQPPEKAAVESEHAEAEVALPTRTVSTTQQAREPVEPQASAPPQAPREAATAPLPKPPKRRRSRNTAYRRPVQLMPTTWCYTRSGYDASKHEDRSECSQHDTREGCELGRSNDSVPGMIWSIVGRCSECACPE
jgi:hypothetical protein